MCTGNLIERAGSELPRIAVKARHGFSYDFRIIPAVAVARFTHGPGGNGKVRSIGFSYFIAGRGKYALNCLRLEKMVRKPV